MDWMLWGDYREVALGTAYPVTVYHRGGHCVFLPSHHPMARRARGKTRGRSIPRGKTSASFVRSPASGAVLANGAFVVIFQEGAFVLFVPAALEAAFPQTHTWHEPAEPPLDLALIFLTQPQRRAAWLRNAGVGGESNWSPG